MGLAPSVFQSLRRLRRHPPERAPFVLRTFSPTGKSSLYTRELAVPSGFKERLPSFSSIVLNSTDYAQVRFFIGMPATQLLLVPPINGLLK